MRMGAGPPWAYGKFLNLAIVSEFLRSPAGASLATEAAP
jgi:hypothetical protein